MTCTYHLLHQDRKSCQSANETGAPPVQLVSWRGKPDSGKPSQYRSEGDLHLTFGQGSTDTAVDAMAEAEMSGGVSVQVEQVRRREPLWVAVGGSKYSSSGSCPELVIVVVPLWRA